MSRTMAWRLILGGSLLAAACGALGQIQARVIPDDAARGTMSAGSAMNVVLDGGTVELAAGAIIRDQNNLIIVPGALPPSADVRYSRDSDGRIARVWVLTDAEKQNAPSPPGLLRFFSR